MVLVVPCPITTCFTCPHYEEATVRMNKAQPQGPEHDQSTRSIATRNSGEGGNCPVDHGHGNKGLCTTGNAQGGFGTQSHNRGLGM